MCEELSIDGDIVNAANLSQWSNNRQGIAAELANFLAEWYSPTPTITLHTSGSTGKPSIIRTTREAMRASAQLSCEVFGLNQTSSALLCLPLRYIAGKMMVVRAMVSGCELVLREPSSTPLSKLNAPVDFAPLVPMQAASTLRQTNGAAQLARARCILLGGGFIDPALTQNLQSVSSCIYASYGMTETLSHIALRRVNGPEYSEWYTPLPGVEISLSPQHTLTIAAAHLGISDLVTHDIAELDHEGRFRILGRQDAVINSGGIKIQSEDIEQKLTAATGLTLLVLSAPHPILGQTVALLWEGPSEAEASLKSAIETLAVYHRPRIIKHVASLPRTDTGKLNRAAGANLL